MSSTNEVDWAKAAAAWASQRQKLQQAPVTAPPANYPIVNQFNAVSLATAGMMPPGAAMDMRMYMNAMPNAKLPYMQYQRPATSVVTAPTTVASAPFMNDAMKAYSNVIPHPWHMQSASAAPALASTVSPLPNMMANGSLLLNSSIVPPINSNLSSLAFKPPISYNYGNPFFAQTIENKLLTTPMTPDQFNYDHYDDLIASEDISDLETRALVKKRIISIVSDVTDSILKPIARDVVNEAHLRAAQQQKQNQDNPLNPAILPVRAAPPVILPPQAQALKMQMSFAPRPVPPVVLGEAGSALEEDHDDLRESADNNGLPFVVYEQPTKGLFRAPPDSIVLPKECDMTTEYIRVVLYTREGQVLNEIDLNGRPAVIFGSNPRQANVIDSHASVYSQQCALAMCTKAIPSNKNIVSLSLFIFPLGGTTKLYTPEQIPFLQEKKTPEVLAEIDPAEHEEQKPQSTNPTEPPIDIISDGDRKRKIPPGKQFFIQLSSSQRYYMIDTSCWTKLFADAPKENEPVKLYETEPQDKTASSNDEEIPTSASQTSLHQSTSTEKRRDSKRSPSRKTYSAARTKRSKRDSSIRRDAERSRHHHHRSQHRHRSHHRHHSRSYDRSESKRRRHERSRRHSHSHHDRSNSRRHRSSRRSRHHS